jgi:sugar lactone lactonase YvrE
LYLFFTELLRIIPIAQFHFDIHSILPIPSSASSGQFQFYATDAATVRMHNPSAGTLQVLGGRPVVRGFADGSSDVSLFHYPNGMALSADEKTLYVCDRLNNRMRAIDTTSGESRTVAGSGEGKNGRYWDSGFD